MMPAHGRSLPFRMLRVFQPYSWRCALLALAIVIVAVLGTAVVPEVARLIIDRALPRRDVALLLVLVLVLCAEPVCSGLLSVGVDYLGTTLGQYVMRDLRVGLYVRLQAVSLRFYSTERTGEIISRLTNDVNGVKTVLTDGMRTTLGNVIALLTTLVVMLSLNVPLTILSLGLTPLFVWLSYRVGKAVRSVSKRTQETMADVSSVLEERLNVSGALLVRSFGRQRTETERFRESNERLVVVQVRQTMIGRWFLLSFHIFFHIAPALVYYVGGLQVIGGALSLGSLVAFIALQSRLFPTVRELLNLHVDMQSALALCERIFEYLDLPIEIADKPGARVLEAVEGHILFRNVGFGYAPGRPVLRDVSFEARPGQLVALVGPSGAGKTTTTYLLSRLYDVAEGAVEIDGLDVRDIALESLSRHVGVVTQDVYLLNATVRENMLYGRPEATEEEMIAAAQAAQIHERIMELPAGYETLVGPRGYLLSGGEKQRLAIARVLVKNPRVLILDEATSALDTRAERLIQLALARLQAGRTTLAIAHRLSTILAADLILVMDGGRIVEQGTHEELLGRSGLYARFYREQFG